MVSQPPCEHTNLSSILIFDTIQGILMPGDRRLRLLTITMIGVSIELLHYKYFSTNCGDAAIRLATKWYSVHLPDIDFILLSDDADCRRRAESEGVATKSGTYITPPNIFSPFSQAKRFVKSTGLCRELTVAHIVRIARSSGSHWSPRDCWDRDKEGKEDRFLSRRKLSSQILNVSGGVLTAVPQYLPTSTLQAAVKAGQLHQGHFQPNPYNYLEASLSNKS
jgi:hypothetical protein